MNNIESNELKKSIFLYGLKKELNFLLQLYDSQRLPMVLMLSGKKGIGKATMIIHFLNCQILMNHRVSQESIQSKVKHLYVKNMDVTLQKKQIQYACLLIRFFLQEMALLSL